MVVLVQQAGTDGLITGTTPKMMNYTQGSGGRQRGCLCFCCSDPKEAIPMAASQTLSISKTHNPKSTPNKSASKAHIMQDKKGSLIAGQDLCYHRTKSEFIT